jgi:hypothetical protein
MPFEYRPSVVFLGLLAAAVLARATGRAWLSPREARTGWLVGLTSALALYPSASGLGRVDTYSWGWGSGPALVAVTLAAVALALAGSRVSWLLFAAVVAWRLGLFESTNLWDYLVDPVFVVAGLVALTGIARRVAPPIPPSGSRAK